MAQPARDKWWNDVVRVDSIKLNDRTYLLWGDRVQVLGDGSATGLKRVRARGVTGELPEDALGGEELLELYFIDVGQGDGVLVVTPEGHHLMVDGGLPRNRQQTGKSAADFVDWKFHRDYLAPEDRDDPERNQIRLDALIASHADRDHYGGLQDLIDLEAEADSDELDSAGVTAEHFYHQGLCPQLSGTDKLGPVEDGHFTSLLGDRSSLVDSLEGDAGGLDLRGEYKEFLEHVRDLKRKSGAPTGVTRLSDQTGFLPGFEPGDTDSEVAIKVLAPIEDETAGAPSLRDLGDQGVNKNGHSIALRLDYKDRRILLTGDLNDKSQLNIMERYGADFASEFAADVAKGCHHGSHHVHVDFLKGVNALSTVVSSGDANTYDHPRAWVLGALAVTGRVVDGTKGRQKAPLIYSTEVARSIALKSVERLLGYDERQEFGRPKTEETTKVSGKQTIGKWRVVLSGEDKTSYHYPPAWGAKVMHRMIYGLVNVRTDGKRLLFAIRNEGNASWALETLSEGEIAGSYSLVRQPPAPEV